MSIEWEPSNRPSCATAPVEIDWGDGSTADFVPEEGNALEASHTYAEAGTYTISVDPLGETGCPAGSTDVTVA